MTIKEIDVKSNKVKVGDVMSFTYWTSVKYVSSNGFDGTHLRLLNVDTGDEFDMHGNSLIESGHSADQYESSRKVGHTQIAEIFVKLPHNIPFTVTFEKKNGSVRKLRGRITSTDEKYRGYVFVEDLDLDPEVHRFRQVDTRTISELIVNNMRYHT